VDDHNAGVFAGPDVLELLDLALVHNVPVVASVRVNARENLHQGGLAGAVLAADGVDLAGLDPQAHVIQRFNAREFLGNGPHLEDDRVRLRGLGRHIALTLQCNDFFVRPAKRRAV
jgi:hypothetical protein